MKLQRLLFLIAVSIFSSCSFMISDLKNIENKLKHNAKTNGVFLFPDKYNCGCDETIPLRRIQFNDVIDDVVFSSQLSGTGIGVNGWKGDSQIPHDAIIENYDFSNYTLYCGNQQILSEERTITFRNCKFKGVRNDPRSEDGMKIKLVFEHCTFSGGISETNIRLYRCYIKEVYGDAMNPLRNFTFEESYVENLLPEADKKGTHVDGTQTYGRDYLIGDNIVFKNSRMEIPNFYFEYYEPGITYSAVNACLMFQLEYNDVNNVTFENMKLNGGGYTIYIQPPRDAKGKLEGHHIVQNNIVFKNIEVGCNHRWGSDTKPDGMIYPNRDPNVDLSTITWQDKIFVSSIFYDKNENTHFIATNDTNKNKKLKIVSGNEEWIFELPKNLNTKEMSQKTSLRFKDLPVDKNFSVNKKLSEVRIFDITVLDDGTEEEIFLQEVKIAE